MNDKIKSAFENGKLILFLGSGATYGCKTYDGNSLPTSGELAELLAVKSGYSYSGESLQKVVGSARMKLGDVEYFSILESVFSRCKPSSDLVELAKFPWLRIYTTNIDDSFENAFTQHSKQKLQVKNIKTHIEDADQIYSRVQYVKLNGSCDRLYDGLIFSVDEYARWASRDHLWYEELASDYSLYTFVFVGSSVNEPLMLHHIERYKAAMRVGTPRSFILVPSMTEIELDSLKVYNIEYIKVVFSDFIVWLKREYPLGLTHHQVAQNRSPALKLFSENKPELIQVLQSVLPVNRQNLAKIGSVKPHGIRNFYRGFKPNWTDIIESVPGCLSYTKDTFRLFDKECQLPTRRMLLVLGPAGSGKTTLLMQYAIHLSDKENYSVYYISEHVEGFIKTVEYLSHSTTENVFIFFDKLEDFCRDVSLIVKNKAYSNVIFVCAESVRIWNERVSEHFNFSDILASNVRIIDESDAEIILDRLKRFGPWTRLKKMTKSEQIFELVTKSKRQLLIGLLEATSGKGFE